MLITLMKMNAFYFSATNDNQNSKQKRISMDFGEICFIFINGKQTKQTRNLTDVKSTKGCAFKTQIMQETTDSKLPDAF